MTKPLIQIGDEVREMTDDEHAQRQADATEMAKIETERAAQTAVRVAALAKLGLTADEAAALFGQ